MATTVFEEAIQFRGRPILLRPLGIADRSLHEAFLARVDMHDMQLRFFGAIRELPASALDRLLQVDHTREIALVAIGRDEYDLPETLAVARAHADSENSTAEVAALVRSDLKGMGLGSLLLDKLIRCCRTRGTERLVADVLGGNVRMLSLARKLGFRREAAKDGIVRMALDLCAPHPAGDVYRATLASRGDTFSVSSR